MKRTYTKFLLMFSMFLGLACVLPACSDDDDGDTLLPIEALPSQAKQFIADYFGTQNIFSIDKSGKGNGTTYEVTFERGLDIDFDYTGNWTEVEAAKNEALPTVAFLPESITNYVTSSYPTYAINKVSRDSRGYEVDLVLGPELNFDLQGNFVSVDRD